MNPSPGAESPSTISDLLERIRELERAQEEYRWRIRRLEARETITRILAETDSVSDAAPRVLQVLCEVLDRQFGAFWTKDEAGSVLKPLATWSAGQFKSFAAASERTYPMGVGLPGRVWLTGEPASIPNLEQDDNFPRAAAAAKDRLSSAFAFPVVDGPQLEGVIELFGQAAVEPDAALLELCDIVGRQVGVFLRTRRFEMELERRGRISALRADLGGSLASPADLHTILTACTESVVKHLSVAFARIWTLDGAGKTLELRASSGLYTHIDGGHSRIPVGAFKIGWIAEKRQPHLTNSVPEDPRVTDRAWAKREGMQAFAGYPLLVEGRLMGVLAMFARFPLEQLVLNELEPIANVIAQFLDRRRTEEELRASEARKTAILEIALDAVVSMNHSGRILDFNRAAEKMFGYERSHVIGQPMADLIIPPHLREGHRAGLARYLNTGEERVLSQRIRIVAMRAGGVEFPVELAITRIPGETLPSFTAYIRELPG